MKSTSSTSRLVLLLAGAGTAASQGAVITAQFSGETATDPDPFNRNSVLPTIPILIDPINEVIEAYTTSAPGNFTLTTADVEKVSNSFQVASNATIAGDGITLVSTTDLPFGSTMDGSVSTTGTSELAPGDGGDALRFRGVTVSNGPDVHYGWIQYGIDVLGGISARSAGVETTPNTALVVPEPSSLGLLALGSAGLVARRRRLAAV